MNRPNARLVDSAKKNRDIIKDLVERLDTRTIEDLARRMTYSSAEDGWGGNSGSEVRTPGIANPTMAAVERLAGGRPETEQDPGTSDTWATAKADPIRDSLFQIFGQLASIAKQANEIFDAAQYVLAAADAAHRVGKSAGGACKVCDRVVAGTEADRFRGIGHGAGCEACYRAWLDAGQPAAGPAWNRWADERKAFLAAKDGRQREDGAA